MRCILQVNKYPWVVALVYAVDGRHFCGGTLVASQYVITAAHCLLGKDDESNKIYNTTVTDFKVRLGEHDLNTTGETIIKELTISVSNIFHHQTYNPNSLEPIGDISVLKLVKEVDLKIYTPACLAKTTDESTFDGKIAQVYGWGRKYTGGPKSNLLLEVGVKVVNNTQCSLFMDDPDDPFKRVIHEGEICAGGVWGEDACVGDSGGPLSFESNGQHILIGDVSWGRGCANVG